jgi:tetratricopeptide (TPR) repeat protein
VFDNAEDPGDLRPYWPSTEAGGRVLVTSRNPHWQPLATPVPVDVLPRPEAIAFLHRRVGIDKDHADQLAAALGDLPLALEQAAAYLEQTHTPAGEYLGLLAIRARELFALPRPATSEQTIATIWTVSLDRVRAVSPVAQELLTLCGFLAPDDLPRALLLEHADALPEQLAAAVRDRLAFHQAIAALRRYSLVTTTGDALRLHRLVQAVTRNALDVGDQHQWTTVAVRLVAAGFPDNADDADAWPVATRLLAHAIVVTNHPALDLTDPQATVSLLHRVTDYLWGRGDYSQAKPLAEQALAICEARLGADHPTTESLNNLAVVLHDQGDLDRARTLHERALAIREARLGPDHPDTMRSRERLAAVLAKLENRQ